MYCSTCELEIKGDDKQTCPICGDTLTAGSDAGVSNGKTPQEQSALHDIIEDINSLIDGPVAATSAPEEAVFVLKDYEDVSKETGEQVQAPEQPLFAASFADGPDMPAPVAGDASQDADVSLQDRLDSIKQSLGLSDTPEADKGGAVIVPREDTGEFGFPQTFEPDGVLPGESADGQAAFLTEFDGDPSELISAHPAAGRPKTGLLVALLVVLIGVGCYYAYRFLADGSSDNQLSTKRTVVPLSALTTEEKQQPATETGAAAPSLDAGNMVPVDAAIHAGADDSQPTQNADSGQIPLPPAEMLSDHDQKTGSPAVADKAVAALQSEAASPPVLEKPAAPAQTRPETQRNVTSVPAQGTAAPEPASAVQPARAAKVTAPFYTVHVGSFRKQSVASSEAERISAKGHEAFVERADLGQRGIWFRVKVGRFKTRAEAESLKAKINKVLVPDGIVVMNRAD